MLMIEVRTLHTWSVAPVSMIHCEEIDWEVNQDIPAILPVVVMD
jgi:hypothetical protein